MASGFDKRDLLRLKEKFARAPEVMMKSSRRAIEKGSVELRDAIRRAAPVDDGRLRKAILHEIGPGDYPLARIFVNYGKKNGLPRAPHGHLVEFGTAPHDIGPIRHPGAKPTPFFFPTYRAYRSRIKRRISRAMKAAAKEISSGR